MTVIKYLHLVYLLLFLAIFPLSSSAAERKDGRNDTLIINARLLEIPGTFPPNDLYNYVYILKYRILKVVEGSYREKEIFVGQYNPLIARTAIKDKMKNVVDGNVKKFSVGDKHILTLIKPIDKVWAEAIEDEYFDDESDKYYALKTDRLKKK